MEYVPITISGLMDSIHRDNLKWWMDPATEKPVDRNVGEMLMLAVSELAEALEGHRKGLMDDHLPHHPMITVELADCMIRVLDIAAGLDLDLESAFWEKLAYNRTRRDHTLAARMEPGGKKY